jgi:CysZ protein
MLTAYVRALGQLFDPRIVRLIGWSIFLSLAVFASLWAAFAWLLSNTGLQQVAGLKTLLTALGGVGTIVLAFFMFPVTISLFLGLFLDAVARAVEARHYPDLPPAKGAGVVAGFAATLRFLLKAMLVNAVLLLFLFAPALYPFAWLAGNAYLLGREYFELAALRRLDGAGARFLRRDHRLSVIAGGAVAVLLFAIPAVNLVAPVVVTMAMVHACERWRPHTTS